MNFDRTHRSEQVARWEDVPISKRVDTIPRRLQSDRRHPYSVQNLRSPRLPHLAARTASASPVRSTVRKISFGEGVEVVPLGNSTNDRH